MAEPQEGTPMSPRNTRSRRRETCPAVREVLNRVGDKWSVQIVDLLGERSMRFSELRRAIEGISQRMLTLTLRGLERDGIVERTVFPSIPPRVDYELTDLGRDLLRAVGPLGDWARRHMKKIEKAREAFDARQQRSAPGHDAVNGLAR